jgi:hypothetical protein
MVERAGLVRVILAEIKSIETEVIIATGGGRPREDPVPEHSQFLMKPYSSQRVLAAVGTSTCSPARFAGPEFYSITLEEIIRRCGNPSVV